MNAEVVPRLAAALASRGVSLVYAPDGREALSYLLQRIPPGARVMNGGSATLEQIGFLDVLRGGSRSAPASQRSEEHTSELQSRLHLVCRLLLEKKKTTTYMIESE